MSNENRDDVGYLVIVNREEQYSIWNTGRPIPPGWKPVGRTGSKEECLSYIKEVWLDLRPASLRKKMSASDGMK